MRGFLRSLWVAGFVGIAVPAGAATVYVAVEGTDTGGCGSKAAPCRSISRGIDVAGAGDTVLVGPGVYGDANADGALDDPGDEIYVPPPCFCAIQVDKAVTIVSEAGAAATIIDVAGLADVAVALQAAGVTFGRRSAGFTVIGALEVGIDTTDSSTGATIAGNVVSGSGLYNLDLDGSGHRVEDNRLEGGANQNIAVSSTATTLARNVATGATFGIVVVGAGVTLTDDVVVGNETGIFLNAAATLTRVAVLSNTTFGISVDSGALTMRGGRVVGNDPVGNCGIELALVTATLDASGVWFGAATGPGADPADAICESGQSVVVEKNPKKPAKLKLKPQR